METERSPQSKLEGGQIKSKTCTNLFLYWSLLWFVGNSIVKLAQGLFIDTEVVRAG